MNRWPRSILRLSARAPDPAPERKSDEGPAAVFRRFFHAIERLERWRRDDRSARDRGEH